MRDEFRLPSGIAPAGARVLGTQPFFYNAGSGSISIASGATASGVIQLQADAAFAWDKLTFHVTVANAALTAATRVIPNITLLLTDTASGRQYMDQATPLSALGGDGSLPYILPVATWWRPNSSIAWIMTSFEAANTDLVRLTFHGTKVFIGN